MPGGRGVVHAYVAAAHEHEDTASVTFVDAGARVLAHVSVSAPDPASACARALRGAVYALWRSRRLGYRRVAVHCDVPAAATLLSGERCPESSLIGPYLEARALMRAYRWARVDVGELRWGRAPGAAAEQLSVLPREPAARPPAISARRPGRAASVAGHPSG